MNITKKVQAKCFVCGSKKEVLMVGFIQTIKPHCCGYPMRVDFSDILKEKLFTNTAGGR